MSNEIITKEQFEPVAAMKNAEEKEKILVKYCQDLLKEKESLEKKLETVKEKIKDFNKDPDKFVEVKERNQRYYGTVCMPMTCDTNSGGE